MGLFFNKGDRMINSLKTMRDADNNHRNNAEKHLVALADETREKSVLVTKTLMAAINKDVDQIIESALYIPLYKNLDLYRTLNGEIDDLQFAIEREAQMLRTEKENYPMAKRALLYRAQETLTASDFEKIKDTIKQDMEKAIEKSRDDRER